ncbi:MAG TPA: hypothetical protein VEV17_17985 [Bryobacteraceae bacterium]|nr:hypothetical protein [Bryobacteraceae bacterium]
MSDASLLAAPAEIVAAPAPADLSCIGTPRPTILPVPLSVEPLAAFLAVPRLPTLAGPALPPELRNLTEWRAGPEQRLGRRIGFPTWIGSVLAAMALFFVAGTLLQYFSGNRNATAAVTQGPQARGTSPANTSAAASAQDSLSRSVEVSGLRLVPGWNHKEQVQFLVVNHSANSLPAISIQITVRAPDSVSTTPPILNINAVIRGLGPYQSKEIRTDLDSTVSPTVFADWQSLRTDIQVTSAE